MKNVLLIIVLCCALPIVSFCQRIVSSRAEVDSLASRKRINELKEIISVTSEQEQQLFEAERRYKIERSQVYKIYWKRPDFNRELAKVEYIKDAAIKIILGNKQYLKYRAILHDKRLQFEAEQKARYKRLLDSASRQVQMQ